jgi:hypothetical protein
MCPRGDCTKRPMPAHGGVSSRRWWCVMNAADGVIRWSTALTVVGVAAVAAVVSYEHAHDESGWTGRLIPLTVDGLIYASSMVMLDSARRGLRVPALARWLLGLGIIATLAANVAHGLGHGIIGALVAAWPAVALVGSYELLMMIIRGAQAPTAAPRPHDGAPVVDPLAGQVAVVSAAELPADRVPLGTCHPFSAACVATRAPGGCASTLLRPQIRMAEAWPHKRRPANSLRGRHASIREMKERND